jgi:hypothetical protein
MKNRDVTTIRATLLVEAEPGIETALGETFTLTTGIGLFPSEQDYPLLAKFPTVT